MQKLRVFLFVSLMALSTIAYSESEPTPMIAIVDVQMILEQSIAVQSIRDAINLIGQDLQKEMSAKEESLKLAEQNIIKKRDTLQEAEFDKEVKKFNDKVSEAQRVMQEKKLRLEQAHASAMTKVNDATTRIIQTMSSEKHFYVALPISHVIYAKNNINITEDVLKRLNQELKSVQVNYK